MNEIEMNLQDLLSESFDVRLKAAKYFSWLARKEYNNYSKTIFESVGFYKKLYPLLYDEKPEVICNIISALGCAYERYRKDHELENELIKLFGSNNKDIIYAISIWTKAIENNSKYGFVFTLLEKTKSEKLISALCDHFNKHTKYEIQNDVQKILFQKLDKTKKVSTQKIILWTLVRIMNKDNLNNFKEYIETKPVKEQLIKVMEIHLSKVEMEKTIKELNIK